MSETNTSAASPEEFLADDMSTLLKQHHRRRTTSTYTVSRSSPLSHPTAVSAAVNTNVHGSNGTTTTSAGGRLANLATSWGVTFGRRKRADEGPSLDSIAQAPSSSEDLEESPTAREILNKF
jgi:autophagy-related protein 11